MKHTSMITMAVVGAFAASTASAQVAASFNGLADDVLEDKNAAFFSGAVNTEEINGSVNIVAGSVAAPGSSSASESANEAGNFAADIDLSVFDTASSTVFDEQSGTGGAFNDTVEASQTTTATLTGAASAATSAASAASSSTTVNSIQQNFGDVSSVAAGAINDSTKTLSETGSLASVDIDSSTGSTAFGGLASNTTGDGIGSLDGALNVASVNGSINMAVTNANVNASSVGSTAAGAINTSEVTATFVGGSEATADVTPP